MRNNSEPWRHNTGRLVLALLATLAMILYAQFVLGHFSLCSSKPAGPNSPGLSFGYSAEQLIAFYSIRNVAELECYGNLIRIWDNIFPLVYTAMYVLWLNYLFRKPNLFFLLPLIRMCADWIENAIELSLLHTWQQTGKIADSALHLGSSVTMVKWGLSFVIYAVMLIGIGLAIRSRFSVSSKGT